MDNLIALRKAITDYANNTGDNSARAALDAHAAFQDKWAGTPELRNLLIQHRLTHQTAGDIMKNEAIRNTAGVDAVNKGLQIAGKDNPDSGESLDKLLTALGPANRDTANQIVLGKALNALNAATTGDASNNLTAATLQKTFSPYEQKLRDIGVSKDLLDTYTNTVADLQNHEQALGSSVAANQKAMAAADELKAGLEKDVAARFIDGTTGHKYQVTSNPTAAFNSIFNDTNAGNAVDRLLSDPQVVAHPEIKRGVQSQALRWAMDNIFGSKTIDQPIVEGVAHNVADVRGAKVKAIMQGDHGGDDQTLHVLDHVFADDPSVPNAVRNALKELDNDFQTRMSRPNSGGSDTMYNMSKGAEWLKDLIRIREGQLSHEGYVKNKLLSMANLAASDKYEPQANIMLDNMLVNPSDHVNAGTHQPGFSGALSRASKVHGNPTKLWESRLQRGIGNTVIPLALSGIAKNNSAGQDNLAPGNSAGTLSTKNLNDATINALAPNR